MNRKPWILWDLTRGQRLRYAAAAIMMGLAIGMMYLAPLVTRGAIDGLLDTSHHVPAELARPPHTDAATPSLVLRVINTLTGDHAAMAWKLGVAGALVVILVSGNGLFTFLRMKLTATASETIARNLRQRLYDHLQHAPCAYHDKAQTGDLVQRCTSDVDTVRQLFGSQIIEVARAITVIVIVVPVLLMLDWKQGLIALSLVPLMVGFAVVFFTKVRTRFKAMDEAEGAMTATLQENLTGIRVVRAFARHDFEKRKFQEKNARHRQLNYELVRLMAFYWSIADCMVFTQMSLVLITGASRVARGTMTIGDLVAFQTYVGMYVWPLRQMGRIVADLGKATIAAGRVQEVLAQPRETVAAAEPLERATGRIELENVTFRHGEKPVLDNLSLSIAPGETIAILGPCGSGKSTLIHLLLRLYDYDTGSIRLDGRELKDLDRKDVRRQFGVVMQEPFLYSKSLRDNIRLGRHAAADDEIVLAAEAACIHEAIDGFEKKYDTLVGERGVTLSGGQRQRVAIARALLIDAPILVLDDALSAVDMQTETQIRAALRQRRGRQTTLLIAHRLSTLMYADRIIVLEDGRITQCGSHDQLVAADGLYRRLWQIQGDLADDLRQELAEPISVPLSPPNADVAAAES